MIDLYDILVAIGIILFITLLSWKFSYELEKEILWATFRMCLQLLLLATVLKFLLNSPFVPLIIIVALFMTINASYQSMARNQFKYAFIFIDQLTIFILSIWPMAIISIYLARKVDVVDPEVIYPILGVLLGNSLNGLATSQQTFSKLLRTHKNEIMLQLSLGATTQEAVQELVNESMRIGIMPSLNAMVSMGIVSIPGIMAGQLLGGGVTPLMASYYQIFLMLMLLASVFIGIHLGLKLSINRHFNKEYQICYE